MGTMSVPPPGHGLGLALLHSLKVRDTLSLGIGGLGEMCLLGQLMRD